MNQLPQIFTYGPSVIKPAPVSVGDVIDRSQGHVGEYQDAIQRGDYHAASTAMRAQLMKDRPDLAAVQVEASDWTNPVWRHAIGACLQPHIKESDFVLQTADLPIARHLCAFRLVDQPEAHGHLKIYLAGVDVPPAVDFSQFFTQHPTKVHWMVQTNPFLVFGVADHDVAQIRLCKHPDIPGEYPLEPEQWNAIDEAFRTQGR